jgi:hypothetical protein
VRYVVSCKAGTGLCSKEFSQTRRIRNSWKMDYLWRPRSSYALAVGARQQLALAETVSNETGVLWENQRFYYAFGWCASGDSMNK